MPINFGASVRRLLRTAGGGTGSEKLNDLPTDGDYLDAFKSGSADPFFQDFTPDTLIRDAIDDINEVLGLLIPAQPPLFPGGQSLNLSTQNNRHLAQGAPFNGNSATVGSQETYLTVYTNTVSQSGVISGSGPGDLGVLTLEVNSSPVETFNLTGDANNSFKPNENANNRFEIFDNKAYPSEEQPFWQEFSVRNIRADIVQGLNNIKMKHNPTDSPETNASANVVYDDLTPLNPSVNIENLTTSATPTVYGGIPHLKSGDTVNISISGSGTSGITYVNNDFCEIFGTNVQAIDRTYEALYGSTPVTGSDLGIVSTSFTVGANPGVVVPKVKLHNSRGNTTDTWSGNKIISVGNTSDNSVRENNIISDKIFLYANRSEPTTNRTDVSSSYDPQSNYPTGSTPESFVGLDPVTELTGPVYDEVAVNVAGEVIPDKENYSSGYLVPGPDYGEKPSVQYFSVSFETLRHTNVSMRYKGKISQLNIGVEYRGTSAWLDTNPYSDNAGSVSSYAPGDSGINTFPTQDNNGNTYYQFTLENANLPGFVPTSPNMKVVYVFKLDAGVSDKLEELSFSRFNDAISGV